MGLLNLLTVFYNPVQAFTAVQAKPKWVLAFNLVVIFTILSSLVQVQFVSLPNRYEMYERFNFSPERIEIAEDFFLSARLYILNILASFLYVVINLVFVALFFYLFFPVLGKDITFKRTFSVVTNSSLIRIPGLIVKTALMIIKGDCTVYIGLGSFFQFLNARTFLFKFLSKFDFFSLWEVILLGIGFSIMLNWSRRLIMLIVIGAWIILNLLLTLFQVF